MQAIITVVNWLKAQMPNIVTDLWSLQLAIIGISVSVMALLFASYVGKVEAHRHTSKIKDINNELMSIYLSNGIKTCRQLNSKIVAVFIDSCILFMYSSMVKYIGCESTIFWMGLADMLLTTVLIVWSVCVIIKVVGQYMKETEYTNN